MNEGHYVETIRKHSFRNYQDKAVSVWHKLPIARRSAVFILLFLGKFGELRVVLTKRSTKLKSFPGHISLPGGKADTGLETEWHTARREMEEEVGLSANNDILQKNYGFIIDHVNILPSYLSRNLSAVRPCVGFMKFTEKISERELINNLKVTLNPGESSGVFSCPLKDFLYPLTKSEPQECLERESFKYKWGGIPTNIRSYTFPQNVANEAEWLKGIQDLSENEDSEGDDESDEKAAKSEKLALWGRQGSRRHPDTNQKIYDVWGLTANILHDLANIAYSENAINAEMGEEELIYSLWHYGNQMRAKERSVEEQGISGSMGFDKVLPRTEFNRLKRLYTT